MGTADQGLLGLREAPAMRLRQHRSSDVPPLRGSRSLSQGAMRVLRDARDRRGPHTRRRGVRDLPKTQDALEDHVLGL